LRCKDKEILTPPASKALGSLVIGVPEPLLAVPSNFHVFLYRLHFNFICQYYPISVKSQNNLNNFPGWIYNLLCIMKAWDRKKAKTCLQVQSDVLGKIFRQKTISKGIPVP